MYKSNPKAFSALIIGAVLIGFSPVLIRLAGAPGIAASFYRLFFGLLTLLVPFIVYQIRTKNPIPMIGLLFAVLAGLCFALDMSFWTTGIMATNASVPTLVGNMSPLWVGLGALFIFREKQPKLFWFGLLLALGGVIIMALRDFFIPAGLMKGIVMGLFSGMFYACYLLLAQPGRKHLDALPFLFISTVSTTTFLGLFMIFKEVPFTGYSPFTWGVFITMGVAFQALAWFLITYAQGFLSASVISPTLLSQPVLAAIIAYFMLGEELGWLQMFCGLMVIAGIFLVHRSRNGWSRTNKPDGQD
jgi:drug/metabolite transporter (DMT)-like permease